VAYAARGGRVRVPTTTSTLCADLERPASTGCPAALSVRSALQLAAQLPELRDSLRSGMLRLSQQLRNSLYLGTLRRVLELRDHLSLDTLRKLHVALLYART
jgi:hypothetical protein